MDTRLAESINTFGHSPKADFPVSPAEPSITVPTNLLQDLLGALQDLKEEVSQLQAERDQDRQELAVLCARIAAVESLEEQDVTRLACDIAQDRRRLSALEKVEPQPLQKDRGDILRALISANGGKMLAKDARQKMRMDKATFSRLLVALTNEIETKPLHQDKRKLLLIIK